MKIPIAVLKVGEVRCSQSFLEFPDAPVTFRLIQGKGKYDSLKLINVINPSLLGPVHIHGHHLIGMDDENVEEEIEDEEIDDEDEAIVEEADEPQKKKQKVAANAKGAKNNDKNSKKK